jgi:hypothetical protein
MQELRGIDAMEYEEIFKKFDIHTTYTDFVSHYENIKKELTALSFTPNLSYQKKMNEKKEFFLKAKNELMAYQKLMNDINTLFVEAQKDNNPIKYLEAFNVITIQKKKMEKDQLEERWSTQQKKAIADALVKVHNFFARKDWMDFAKTTNSLSDFDQKCNEIIYLIQMNANGIISVDPIEKAPKVLREQNTTCKKIIGCLRNISTDSSLHAINEELPSLTKKWNSLKLLSIRWHDEEVSKVHKKLISFISEYVHSKNFVKELSILQKKHPDSKKSIDKNVQLLEELVRSLKDESLLSALENLKKSFSVQDKASKLTNEPKTMKPAKKVIKSSHPTPVDISQSQILNLIQKQFACSRISAQFSLLPTYPFVGFFSSPLIDKKPPNGCTPPKKKIKAPPIVQKEQKQLTQYTFLLNAGSTRINYPMLYDEEPVKECTYPPHYLQELNKYYTQVFRKHINTIEREMEELIPSRSFHENFENFNAIIQWIQESEFLSYLNSEECKPTKTRVEKVIEKILLNENKTKQLFGCLQKTSERFDKVIKSLSQSIVKMTMNTLKKYTEAIRSEKNVLESLQSDIDEIILDSYTSHYAYKYIEYKKNNAFNKLCILEELLEKAKIHHNLQIQRLLEYRINCRGDIEEFIEKGSFYQKFSDHSALLTTLKPLFKEVAILKEIFDGISAICANHPKSTNQVTQLAKSFQRQYRECFAYNNRLQKCYNILFEEWIDQNVSSLIKKKMCKHAVLLKQRNENDQS